jgi:hypothetical protein
MVVLLLMLASVLAHQYPPGQEPAKVYADNTGHSGRAQDGRPEAARPYPPGTEPAHQGNANLANEREK